MISSRTNTNLGQCFSNFIVSTILAIALLSLCTTSSADIVTTMSVDMKPALELRVKTETLLRRFCFICNCIYAVIASKVLIELYVVCFGWCYDSRVCIYIFSALYTVSIIKQLIITISVWCHWPPCWFWSDKHSIYFVYTSVCDLFIDAERRINASVI